MASYLRGTRKALERTPHRLFGNKSVDDRVIVEWVKDFKVAQDGLHFLSHEIKSWAQKWKLMLETQANFVSVFEELCRPIVEDKHSFKEPQVTPASMLAYVSDFNLLAQDLSKSLLPLIDSLVSVACDRINTIRPQLDAIEKRLTKRDHKKIDYDRASEALHKAIKKSTNSDKDKVNIDSLQLKFDEATDIFMAIDADIRSQIPVYLSMLSEFLNPFTTWIFYQQLSIHELLHEKVLEFSITQGLTECSSMHPEPETLEDISYSWRDRFLEPFSRVEEGLKLIRSGETVKTAYADWDSEKHTQFIDKAKEEVVSTTKGLVDKAQKPFYHDKPMIFSSDQGLFQGEADPLVETGNSKRISVNLKRRSLFRSVSTEQGLSPVSPTLHSFTSPGESPIPCRLEVQHPSNVIRRARAWSSSSARALSPRYKTLEEVQACWDGSERKESVGESASFVTALYSFSGQEPGDVSFQKGDTLKLLYKASDEDWWVGETQDGRYGFFPRNRVGQQS